MMSEKPTILYVDDEDINQYLFQINLSEHYNVVTAGNGFEGLQILKKNKGIRLVASDMKMPIMNGLEFIEKAKKMVPNLPFFLLTGFDITPEIKEALNSKFIKAHFKKPFDIVEIHAVFSKALI